MYGLPGRQAEVKLFQRTWTYLAINLVNESLRLMVQGSEKSRIGQPKREKSVIKKKMRTNLRKYSAHQRAYPAEEVFNRKKECLFIGCPFL